MTTRPRLLAAAGLTAAAAIGLYAADRALLPPGAPPGLRIEGRSIPTAIAADEQALARWIEDRVDAVRETSIEIRVGRASDVVALGAIVAKVDGLALARRAHALASTGGYGARLDVALRARRGEVDLPLPLAIDTKAVDAIVEDLKRRVDEPATDARLDLGGHAIVEDHEGRLLEANGAAVTLAAAATTRAVAGLRSGLAPAEAIELTTTPLVARVTKGDLAKLEIGEVVGTFETHFGRGGDQAPRAVNIETAAKKLDGLVLRPGEFFSFNEVVGERSEANGFKTAWEIFKGEMRPGVGGGTCQVASTLHAAAFFGGLEILERLPHSRPSAYIPMGLDATVVFPVVDLKIRNPHPFPVVVHTKVGANSLVVELLGKEKPARVVFAREVVEIFPFVRKIVEEPWVKEGQAIKKQGGIRGYRVRRIRRIEAAVPRVETSIDFYPPTTEIFVVAPGADPAALPPLPTDVAEALARKSGESAESSGNAVACAGECGDRPVLEVKNGAGVHDPVGDQVSPTRSVSIAR
jgi:vancomycin resistance protein YoaR